MTCVRNGTNRYSTAVLIDKTCIEILCLEKSEQKQSRISGLFKNTHEYYSIAYCKQSNIVMELKFCAVEIHQNIYLSKKLTDNTVTMNKLLYTGNTLHIMK